MNTIYVLMWRENEQDAWQFTVLPKSNAYEKRDYLRGQGWDAVVLKGE